MTSWVAAVIFSFYPEPIPVDSFHPAPTKEQFELIEKLGDENFIVREKAEENLEKLDLKVYKALCESIRKNENPEIRHRCSRVLSNILSYKTNKKIPNLYSLYDLKVKLKSGRIFTGTKQLFKEFFIRSSNNPHNNRLYPYQIIEIATYDLLNHLRLIGFSKEEIHELIDCMNENLKHLYKTHNYKFYEWIN